MIKSRLTVFVSCLFVLSFLLAPSPARTAKTQGAQAGAFDSVVAWYSGSYVQVSWDHDAQVRGYNVYRFTSSMGFWEKLNQEPFQAYVFVDSSAPKDSVVFYRVGAIGIDDSENDVALAVRVLTAEAQESLSLVQTAQAYDKNNIITDSQLTDAAAMSQTQIQNFLNSQGSVLANYSTGGKTAAQHIYDNCQTQGISPYVVLVTLQKEKNLIKSSTANPNNFAMGWNTSDSSTSDFANQIYYGTRQFRRYYDNLGNYGWAVSQPHSVSDDSVTAANIATAGLYIYTPWIGQGGGGQEGVGGNYLFWDLWYNTLHFASSFSATITQPPGVVLNPDGTSTIGWMFETTDWTNTRGPGTETHVGDDWYADDWARGCGQTAGQNLYSGITGVLELNPDRDGREDYYGNTVVIYDSTSSFALRYAHMKEFAPGLVNGQLICSGQFVGKVGNTGNVSSTVCTIDPGAHLHVVLYKNVSSLIGRPIHSTSFSGGPTTYSAPFLYQPQRQRIVDSNCSVTTCDIGSSTLRNRDNGPPIHPPGSVIKTASISTVYLIDADNRKRPLSASALSQLYNQSTDARTSTNFNSWVITIGQDELDLYEPGGSIFSAQPGNGQPFPDGKLISYNGQVSIVTGAGKRRPFVTESTFTGLGFKFCQVVSVSQTEYNSYPTGPAVDAMPMLTSSVNLNPAGPYTIGQNITGSFTVKNVGFEPLPLFSLGIGGRLNGTTVYDMNFVSTTLAAGSSYNYSSQPRQLTSGGTYDFFAAYQENNGHWAISVPAASGIIRSKQISVGACTYSVSPTSASFSASGGSGSFGVTTPTGCGWSASSDVGWITTSSSGTGSGTVNYSVAQNSSTTSRTGHVTVQGQTHTVNQAGINCAYSISPPSASFSSGGGPGSFSVGTQTGCVWSASSDVSWITTSSSGTGSGTVNYSVAQNASTTSRTGHVNVQGQSHTVNQAGTVSALPDLIVTALTAPSTGSIGGQITVSVGVVNQGSANAGAFRLGFYVSTNSTITTGDVNTGWSCDFPSGLAAGASTTCGGQIGVPSSLSPGTYYVGAIVDDLGAVAESNETNNARSADTGPIVLSDTTQGTCVSPYTLTAGQVFSGNTSGGQSSFGSYSCVGWDESGPERVHTLTLTSAGTLAATLSNLGGHDLDVFILTSCSAGSCLALGDNSVSADVGPGTYYILVDGYQGDVGSYTLTVTSTGPSNGDTDGDGIPDSVEPTVGRNWLVKDNDIFNIAQLFSMQQYRDFLGREGDLGGISFWTNQINSSSLTRAQVIDSFFNSPEFQGTVSPVTRLYFAYFLRIPDYGGLNFWVNQYRQGATLASISQAFAASPEFQSTYGSLNNTQFVTLLYQNVLGRAPDSGGLAFWVGQLNSGATRGSVMLGFSESAEYKQSSFNKVYVTMIYVGMLRRAPEQGGFDFWVGAMNNGASGLNLIQGFLGAPEYHNRFLP